MKDNRRFSALYVRDFRLFWFAQLISLSGTWMHSAAQGWLVYSLTKSPLYLGIIASLASLPILLFTFIGGVVADKHRKKGILIITQSLSVVPALVIGILADSRFIEVWHVGVGALFLGTINAFDIPARQSFLAELVSKEEITNAIALNSTAFNGARITGPLIAGFLIEHLGIPACFYLNALSFIPVIVALYLIKTEGTLLKGSNSGIRGITEGLNFVRKNRSILSVLMIISLFSLFAIPYINMLPAIAGEVFNKGVKGLSILMASIGLGAFSGALIIAFMKHFDKKVTFIPLSAMAFSLSLIVIALSREFYITMIAMVVSGWGVVTCLALSNGFIQEKVSDNLRGRVISLYIFVFLGLAPIGNALMGIAADLMGTMTSLTIFSVVVVLASTVFSINFRRLCEDTCS